jgi:O-antigen ligase
MAGALPPAAAAKLDRAALWIAVAIGFSLPISTALDGLLEVMLVACWIAGGGWRERLSVLRNNAFVLFPCAFVLLHLAGSVYSLGHPGDIWNGVGKASTLLLIPLLISLRPGAEWRNRALQAFAAAMLLTLALSFLFWWGFLPEGGFIKGTPYDAVVFKLKITHSVFMAFTAYLLALYARDSRLAGRRWLFAVLALLAGFNVLFMVQGRTGQLVLMALTLYFFVSWLRWRGLLAGAAAAAALSGTVYLVPSSALHQRVQTSISEFTSWRAGKPATLANMRLESWTNSLEIVRQHPVLGAGTGGFAAAYAKQVEGTSMSKAPQPENQYLLTAVQLGALGLAALLTLFATQWHLAARLATPMDTELARALVLTMAVGCLFNSFLWDHTEALFYAWLTGLLFAGLRPRETAGR